MQDELYWNKVAFVALATLLLFFGLPILVNAFYGGGGHGSPAAHEGEHGEEHAEEGNPLGLAYPIEFTLEGGGAAEAAPEADLGTLLAEASAASGERGVAICKACHTFEQGGANGTGPNLWGVIGRDIASEAGFSYTGALQAEEGVWTYEAMDAFLANSQAYVPGTAMAQRIGKADKRADILAYLSTLTSGTPVAFPQPMVQEDVAEGEHGEDMAAAEGEAAELDDQTEAESGIEDVETGEEH